MKKKTMIISLIILIFLTSFVNSELLVSTSIDKETISSNEIAILTIQLYSPDSDYSNYSLRLETTPNLVFLENGKTKILNNVESITKGVEKEIKIRFKSLNSQEESGKIFAYYGNKFQFVSGTFITTKELLIKTSSKVRKIIDDSGEKIIIDFEMHNYSKKPIEAIAIEITPPQNFVIDNPLAIIPILQDNNGLKKTFEILPPLGINGEYEIKLAYGFFDETGPHYFEETHNIEFEKNNNLLLTGLGIIILVIAVLIYLSQKDNNQSEKVKGTKEKTEE